MEIIEFSIRNMTIPSLTSTSLYPYDKIYKGIENIFFRSNLSDLKSEMVTHYYEKI